jgi:glycosyltransferase involved in cell wall biosynthesis
LFYDFDDFLCLQIKTAKGIFSFSVSCIFQHQYSPQRIRSLNIPFEKLAERYYFFLIGYGGFYKHSFGKEEKKVFPFFAKKNKPGVHICHVWETVLFSISFSQFNFLFFW